MCNPEGTGDVESSVWRQPGSSAVLPIRFSVRSLDGDLQRNRVGSAAAVAGCARPLDHSAVRDPRVGMPFKSKLPFP